MKAVFIGRYISALNVLCEHADLLYVLSEKDKTSSTIAQFCADKGIEQSFVSNSLDIEEVAAGGRFKESILVSANCGVIFSQSVINSFRFVINFHPGDIFECRGAAPLLFAIKKKMQFMGWTSHIITSCGIDCGPIIFRSMIPISYNKSYYENEKLLLSILPEVISATLKMVRNSEFVPLEWFSKKKHLYNQRLSFEDWRKITAAATLNDALGD